MGNGEKQNKKRNVMQYYIILCRSKRRDTGRKALKEPKNKE